MNTARYAGAPSRAIDQMVLAAVDRLQNRSPQQLAAQSGARLLPDGELSLSSLGREILVTLPDCRTDPLLDGWHYLLLLHYLDLADGAGLAGRWITFGEMPEGLIRGVKFDRTVEESLGRFLLSRDQAQVNAAFRSLGGEFLPSKADLTVRLLLFPYFPVQINIWFADEEFSASARMLLDGNAGHVLTVEDAVVAGELILRLLENSPSR